MPVEVGNYGATLEVSDEELSALEEIFEEGDVGQYFSENVVALARDDEGGVIGGITESGGDELTIGVDPGWQGSGIGFAMIKAFLAVGGSGFMVAGTDAGLEFLSALYWKLTEEEREQLDVPSWEQFEEEKDEW